MNKTNFSTIENYMLECMQDSAHDKDHIYRVLYVALEIADAEQNVDIDILITACLLHDIGRKEQYENPSLCHAQIGAKKAYEFLTRNSFSDTFAEQVAMCINSHRYRGNNPPQSIEAKILFDADKIDATGTLGIARTIFYKGIVNEPLYTLDANGFVLDGSNDKNPSFFQEYKYKLEKVYNRFYTEKGMEIAEQRRSSAIAFYNSMLNEVQESYKNGIEILNDIVE